MGDPLAIPNRAASATPLLDRGNWSATTAYAISDVVTNAAQRYACKTAHTSAGSFSGTNWTVLTAAAALSVGTSSGTVAAGDDGRITGAVQATNNLSDVTAVTARANLGAAQGLIRTAVKTSAYTAAAGDLVPVDTTAGAVTITLPTAPADKSRIGVKHIIQGGTNAVTIATGGSDVLNKAGGSTSSTLPFVSQAQTYDYQGSTAVWTITSSDLPVASLAAAVGPAIAGKLVSGLYYFCTGGRDTGSATAPNGTLRLVPWFVPNPITVIRVGTEVTIVGDSTAVFRLGIYADDGTGYPGSLMVDGGTISGFSVGTPAVTVSTVLPAGLYWVGGAGQGITATAPTIRAMGVPNLPVSIGTTAAPSSSETRIGYQTTGVTGALPSPFPAGAAVAAGTSGFRIYVKVG